MLDNIAVWLGLSVVFVLATIGVILLVISNRRMPKLNVEKYRSRWLAIESNLDKDSHASWLISIINADKLVDQALRDSHYSGKTMGERMKSAQKVWSNANHVWSAHKIRNHIAHESDVKVNYDIARRALAAYKQALKDLGAI